MMIWAPGRFVVTLQHNSNVLTSLPSHGFIFLFVKLCSGVGPGLCRVCGIDFLIEYLFCVDEMENRIWNSLKIIQSHSAIKPSMLTCSHLIYLSYWNSVKIWGIWWKKFRIALDLSWNSPEYLWLWTKTYRKRLFIVAVALNCYLPL